MHHIINELNYALEFTKTYKRYEDKAIREAQCLKLQVPHVLVPIEENDLIAGRMRHSYLGFSPQYGGVYTYFFHEDEMRRDFEQVKGSLEESLGAQIEEMILFWHTENTHTRLNERFFEKYGCYHPAGFTQPGATNCDARVAGTNVDLDKLIRLGLGGLRREIKGREKNSFYTGLLMSIDILTDAIKHYENQALTLAKTAAGARKKQLLEMARILSNIQHNAPASFKEGLQLFWIYSVVSDLMNYGRMDVYLGDLYAGDLDGGDLTEEEAIAFLTSLYQHLIRIGKIHDSRIIIGGRGRRNEQNADRLAMVLMEVSARVKDVVPQLTLRYYKGMNEALYKKALRVNALGTTFPMIYSDETNIPAISKVYDVPVSEAERYVPFGCGEYVLEGLSTGTPNNGVNLLKALELALFNGYDHIHHQQAGVQTGEITDETTFDELWQRYHTQLAENVQKLAWHKWQNYAVANEQASYLYMSLLMDDCVAKGKAMLDGGVRYLNAASEVFGIISAADSFSAVKKVVYEDKAFTLKQLVHMLSVNFEGYARQQKLLLDAPKYGNDNDIADAMAVKVFEHISDITKRAGEQTGLHKYAIVSVNNSMSAEWGVFCMASADGRRKGQPMNNGNGACIGADKNGITALLNSMAKFDASTHVGVIHNVRFTREMLENSFDKVKELIRVFLENNGVQLNLTVIRKEDLVQAMAHPEKYPNLLVRIGGFSARFVSLSRVIQNEIIHRTTYR